MIEKGKVTRRLERERTYMIHIERTRKKTDVFELNILERSTYMHARVTAERKKI